MRALTYKKDYTLRKRLGFLLLISLLSCDICAWGQTLPSLKQAKEISQGKLANNIDYYIVNNPQAKGYADFALVSREKIDEPIARAALSQLTHFHDRVPYKFFSDYSVSYEQQGYISQAPDATSFKFSAVPIYKQSVCDSTLLALMDLASISKGEQAVIVSGDVDSKQIIERLKLLSLITPKIKPSPIDSSYKWQPSDSSELSIMLNYSRNIVAISAIINEERVRAELMNTPQPLVIRGYAEILGEILRKRLQQAFSEAQIPLADVHFIYHDSSLSHSDELYAISVITYQNFLDPALTLLSTVLSQLDSKGVSAEEFSFHRRKVSEKMKRDASISPKPNSYYIQRCSAAFLYGADLASDESKLDLFAKRVIPVETELPIFNAFTSALLDPSHKLTLRFDSPSLQLDTMALMQRFSDAWIQLDSSQLASKSYNISKPSSASNVLIQAKLPEAKVKLSSDVHEAVSGGRLWTFSNGLRIIYKKLPTQGQFYYGLMLRGGLPAVSGIRAGEAAFASDMLSLCKLGGMKGCDFFENLEAEGISMHTEFTMHDFRISGYATKDRVPMLLQTLAILANEREVDDEQFLAYKREQTIRCEAKALYPIEVEPILDSIMRPNYLYHSNKRAKGLSDVLPYKVDKYLSSAFTSFNSGVLVLAGDLDEDNLKKYLLRVLGNFPTEKLSTQRIKVSSRYIASPVRKTRSARGGLLEYKEKGAYLAISAPVIYNISNHYAFYLAQEYIKSELSKALADKGAYFELRSKFEDFPSERMTIYIECHPCFENGLPSGVERATPQELMQCLKDCIASLSQLKLDDGTTKAYKQKLQSLLDNEQKQPEFMIDAILTRYGSGKDVYSGSKDAISSLSHNRISEILSSLSGALTVEYIID